MCFSGIWFCSVCVREVGVHRHIYIHTYVHVLYNLYMDAIYIHIYLHIYIQCVCVYMYT